jgi:uncharacterized protein (DUF58 family)
MLSPQTIARIRQLAVVTKRLMDGPLVGDDVAARRGYGVELDQLREYQFGDDVRFIDFKSSCRLGKMMTKECLEERNRRIILAIDVSASAFYGSAASRITLLQDVAAMLAFASYYARDSVGLLLFAQELELVIQPSHTHAHLYWVLQHIYQAHAPEKKGTTMSVLLTHVAQQWHKDAVVFIISDFIVDDCEMALRSAAAHVDLVALRCYDPVERAWPFAGYVAVEDIERGTHAWLNGKRTIDLNERVNRQNVLFAQLGIDVLDLTIEQDMCARLIEFFKRRMVHATIGGL